MARRVRFWQIPIPLLSLFLLLLLALISGGSGCSDWCVASNAVSDEVVQKALDWVCTYGSACNRIQPGQPCYKAGDLRAVASIAFNQYWQDVKEIGTPCHKIFNAANVIHTDPSLENCSMPCT